MSGMNELNPDAMNTPTNEGSPSSTVGVLPVEGNLKNLLWILGYAFFWAWFIMVLFGNVVFLPYSPTLMVEPLFRAVAFVALVIAFAALLLASRHLDARRHIKYMLIIALVLSPWVPIAYLAVVPPEGEGFWMLIASWAAFGISSALLSWTNMLHISILDPKSVRSVLGIAATLGAIIYLFMSQIAQAASLSVLLILPILASICHGFARPQNPTSFDQMDHEHEGTRSALSNAGYALVASLRYQPGQPFFGTLFGISIATGISAFIQELGVFPFELGICLCLSGPVLLVFATMPKMVPVETIQWFLMPVTALSILPIVLGVQSITLICCGLLGFCYTFYALIHSLSLNELMHENPAVRNEIASSGMILMYIGMLVGWCVSYAFFAAGMYESVAFRATLILVAVVMVFAISVIGRPSKRNPDTLIIRERPENSQKLWEESCQDIARECKLSPRQTEIFMYLAKGRNASYIEEKLVVSYHTVKAHIYRIYQKLDVHSQQDLINVVEEHMSIPR